MSKKHVAEWSPAPSKGLGLEETFTFSLHFKWQHKQHKRLVQNGVCSARDTGNVTKCWAELSYHHPGPVLMNLSLQGGWVLISDSKGFFFFFPLTSFPPVQWQKFFFYQWDVCVGRKADGCEEISKFPVGLQELRPVQCWVSLTAASHRWKITLCAGLFPFLLWSTPVAWAALPSLGSRSVRKGSGYCSGKSWHRAGANLPLNCFFSWGCQLCAASR